MRPESAFDDLKVHVKLKLSFLWTALMFFYIYMATTSVCTFRDS